MDDDNVQTVILKDPATGESVAVKISNELVKQMLLVWADIQRGYVDIPAKELVQAILEEEANDNGNQTA